MLTVWVTQRRFCAVTAGWFQKFFGRLVSPAHPQRGVVVTSMAVVFLEGWKMLAVITGVGDTTSPTSVLYYTPLLWLEMHVLWVRAIVG